MHTRQLDDDHGDTGPTSGANIKLLLLHIKQQLDRDWTFYAEFIDGVVDAIIRGEGFSAWIEQISRLVDARKDISHAHERILFILGELEGDYRIKQEHSSAPSGPETTHPTPAPINLNCGNVVRAKAPVHPKCLLSHLSSLSETSI